MNAARSLFALLCVSAPALADQADVAAQFFDAGAAAAKRKDYRVCAEAFAEAHRRAAHGAAIYNAALCWQAAKDRVRAANGYREALTRSADLSQHEQREARSRLEVLAKDLAQLEIRGPSGSSVSAGPLVDARLPVTTFVEPGAQRVEARGRDGAEHVLELELSPGEKRPLEVVFEEQKREPAPAPSRTKAAAPPAPEPAGSPAWQAPLGFIGLGAGAVTAAIGGVFYLAAVDARDQYDAGGDRDPELHDRASSRLQTARILGIAGAVVAGVGLTLLLTADDGERKASSARLKLEVAATGARTTLEF